MKNNKQVRLRAVVTQVVDAFCGALMMSELSALALVRHVLIKDGLLLYLRKGG